MTTNLSKDYCSLSNELSLETPEDKEKAIEDYSYCIKEAKKCLKFLENPISREKICKKIALGYNERGFIKYQKVDFEEAIEDFTKALSFDPSLYFTYYNRGLIHYRLGRYDDAIQDMREALSIEMDFQPAWKCLEQAKIDKAGKEDPEQQRSLFTEHPIQLPSSSSTSSSASTATTEASSSKLDPISCQPPSPVLGFTD